MYQRINLLSSRLDRLVPFFGFGTWDELKEMQRKIRAQREKEFYSQKERQRAIIEGVSIVFLILLTAGIIFGIMYLIGVDRGLI